MTKVYGYKGLIVWQKSIDLVAEIYSFTKEFPKEELFGLTAQLRRASISIPSNIAEGIGRNTAKDFHHFLSMAYGSTKEVKTQLIISKRLSFGKKTAYTQAESLLDEVAKMLNKMVRDFRD